MGVDWEGVVGGVEHLGQRDEVEEQRGDGGGDGDVAPAGAVVERGGQDGERGYAVEENRESEPEEGHIFLVAGVNWPQTLSISWREEVGICSCCHVVVVLPPPL